MEYKKCAFEESVLSSIINYTDLYNKKEKSYFQSPITQLKFSYFEIATLLNENRDKPKMVKMRLQQLINATCYAKLNYDADFEKSGFDKVIVENLNNAELYQFFIRLTINYTALDNCNYLEVLLKDGLIKKLFSCFISHEIENEMYSTSILIIFRNLVFYSKDCCIQICNFMENNLDRLITLFKQDEQNYQKYFYKLLNLILYKNATDLSFLFETISTIFENNYKKKDIKESLFMIYFALFATGFPEYTKGTCIKNLLINMMNEVRSEPLMKILSAIFIKFMNYDIEIIIDLIPRFIDLLLSGFEDICTNSAYIISQILSFEPEWIKDQKKLAINLINKIPYLGYESKVKYLNCLILLLNTSSNELLEDMIENGLISIFKDSCESDDNSIIFDILKAINKVIDIEISENKASLIFNEITKENGTSLLNDLINSDHKEISELSQIIVNKINEYK